MRVRLGQAAVSRADRPLFVGEDFGNSEPRYHRDLYALTGASGERLAKLAGIPLLQFAIEFDRTNVVTLAEDWRDRELVQAGVCRVVARASGRRAVLLGSRVARAFGVDEIALFSGSHVTIDGWRLDYVRMPHPSGRSHWWNDPEHVAQAREFMRSIVF